MFKSILVPIDLTNTDLAKPAVATAVLLSQTSNGTIRLLNVLHMTPVMLTEYVPADFDMLQPVVPGGAGNRRTRGGHRTVAHFQRGAAGQQRLSRDS